jgi:hypothetical protein
MIEGVISDKEKRKKVKSEGNDEWRVENNEGQLNLHRMANRGIPLLGGAVCKAYGVPGLSTPLVYTYHWP